MSKKIKPFSGQGRYTIFDNIILDHIMPGLSPNSWKCLCFIIRKTVGWQKDIDAISFSQIRKGTGIGSNATVSKALKELESRHYILVGRPNETWESNLYTLNTGLEIELETSPSTETVLEPSTETVNTKHIKQKEKQRGDFLSDLFTFQEKGTTETTAPNPDDQWIKYGSKVVEEYRNQTGVKVNESQRGELGLLTGEDGFDWDFYLEYLGEFASRGGYAYDVKAFCEGYHTYRRTGDIYDVLRPNKKKEESTTGIVGNRLIIE